MLTAEQIEQVGRMLDQTGGREDRPSPDAHVMPRIREGEKVIRIKLHYVTLPSGDVTIAPVENQE